MRFPIHVYFFVVFLVLSVNGADKSTKSCAKPYDKMMVCNLMCDLLQDSDANDAIKMLQAKLESLIAVVNKPSPTLPPGKSFNSRVLPSFLLIILNHICSSRRWRELEKYRACSHHSSLSRVSLAHQSTKRRMKSIVFILMFVKIASKWLFTFFTAVLASSCKEQYEKRRWVLRCTIIHSPE